MQGYSSKEEFIAEVQKRGKLFIDEFREIAEQDKDVVVEEVDRSPSQMIAYQLGWLDLLQSWEADEQAGIEVVTPQKGYKWNQLGSLYQSFYQHYQDWSLQDLISEFEANVERVIIQIHSYSEEEFQTASRRWACSTTSKWPVWKWLHINTVAPFKTFRTKIRKWKKVRKQNQ